MRTRHLLLIDDEDDIREVAGLDLGMTQGWTITTANGHAAGIAVGGTCAPDAMLLDVMHPIQLQLEDHLPSCHIVSINASAESHLR
jgi:CheY-like chemotaxis protein